MKFQTHIADAESTRDEPFQVKFSDQDDTRLEYWRRMEFSSKHWAGLATHARHSGLHFLSLAFSLEAVVLLSNLDVPAWKIASGEVGSEGLVNAICADARPVLLSTGMSPWADIDLAVSRIRQAGTPVAVLQCVSRYPTPLADVGLNVIDEMGTRYDAPAGLSDHSGQPWPALAAISRGTAIIELHITLSDRMFGPDVPSSLTVEQFRIVADLRDAVAVMDAYPGDKDGVAEEPSLLLEPTSPIRVAADLVTTVDAVLDNGYRGAVTVSPTPAHFSPHKTLTVGADRRVGFLHDKGTRLARRQEVPALFHRNGLCYALARDLFLGGAPVLDDDCAAIVVEREVVNIDDPFELELAEWLLQRQEQGVSANQIKRSHLAPIGDVYASAPGQRVSIEGQKAS